MIASRFALRALVALFVLLGFTVSATPCTGQVRINEILADPVLDWNGDGTVHFKDDEWIEIVNTGGTSASLDDLRVSDGGSTVQFRYGFSGTLAPGSVQVVYGSESVAWETANGFSTVGLSLNNTGDSVQLWSVAGGDTVLVDSHDYVSHEVQDDRTTGRLPDGTGDWFVFDALNPYTGTDPPQSTGCSPSPDQNNDCPTAIESVTWSALKQLFDAH